VSEISADNDLTARLGIVSAAPPRRMLAFVLDVLVLLAVTAPLWLVAGDLGRAIDNLFSDPGAAGHALRDALIPLVIGLGLGFVLLTVQLIVGGVRGVTIGKAAFGLRAVSADTLLKPGIANMMLRGAIVWTPGVLLPVLGAVPFLASGLADPTGRGRGWHDRASGVWLVDVRAGLDPRDREALRAARRELTRPPEGDLRPLPSLASVAPVDPALTAVARSTAGVISPAASEPVDWQPELRTPAAGPRSAPTESPAAPPAAPAAPAPAPDVEMSAWDLVLDDGSRRRLPVRTLIGRAPTMPTGADDYALVAMTDPAMEMSRTHLAVTVEDGRVWIADLDTPNGTDVLLPGGERVTLAPREPLVVEPGSRVSIGDRTFTFEEAAQ